jgi:hypothetical protein
MALDCEKYYEYYFLIYIICRRGCKNTYKDIYDLNRSFYKKKGWNRALS